MMKLKVFFLVVAVLITTAVSAGPLTDPDEIVARANLAAYYAGDDGRSEVRMIITDAQGRQQRHQFTVLRRNVEDIGGHPTVTISRVSDLVGGGQTDMQFRYIAYDIGLPEQVFTERSMRNPPREYLTRPGR